MKKYVMQKRDLPDAVIEEVHAELFETLGCIHGREQMLAVGQHLRADQELIQHSNRWQAQKDGADISGYL